MNKKLIEDLKNKLENQKTALTKELSSFATEDKNLKNNWDTKYPNRENGNMEEEADEVQEYDNLLSLEHNLELRLKDVDSALEKIENGKYGICEKCGNEIDENRLQACPEARACIKCKK
ncbi:MAG: TraR/DksA C4-type zinc finger protein [Candidatus Woesearchaeota archaeon]|nr:TraR/DksA C4-type zinc finger protein [Candidatus Woesearchaeota archaeon]